MVQKPATRRANFVMFIAPALFLYALFFLLPFGQGLRISVTNWDGLTPKTPISMPKAEFEEKILNRIESEKDRDYVLSIYTYDEASGEYSRLSIRGLKRYRLERIIKKVGYSPDLYRDVGLDNYRSIFRGQVDERFYPRRYEQVNFNANSDLPQEVDGASYEKDFLTKLTPEQKDLASQFYVKRGKSYILAPGKDEFNIEDPVWMLPEVDSGAITSAAVDDFIAGVKKAGLGQNEAAFAESKGAFVAQGKFAAGSLPVIDKCAQELFSVGKFKALLSEKWRVTKTDLGVIGFTIFFALGNVLISNFLAFWIALALDQKGVKSRNVLRSIFFMPNVLSMVVVALIWSFLFFHLLPQITGIQTWMSDPAKAPWLLVFVSVWQSSGYYMVIYLAGLQNIPQDIIEAAMIDGASPRQRLRHITLPLLAPSFTVCIFMSIANALKCFDLVYAMIGPSGYAVGTVPFVMDIFFDAFARKQAGLANAKAALLFLTIAVVTGLQLKMMKKKEVQL
ncbi:MAG: sugar ABC transporter permease [Spirochaetaceae bacterium]|nr:sugar ABC transporter permease [Spirochaetaceae bacterium]